MDAQGNIRGLKDDDEAIKAGETELSEVEAKLLKTVDKKERWALLKRIRRIGQRDPETKVLRCSSCKRPMATVRNRLVQKAMCSRCISVQKRAREMTQPRPIKQDLTPRQRRKANRRAKGRQSRGK